MSDVFSPQAKVVNDNFREAVKEHIFSKVAEMFRPTYQTFGEIQKEIVLKKAEEKRKSQVFSFRWGLVRKEISRSIEEEFHAKPPTLFKRMVFTEEFAKDYKLWSVGHLESVVNVMRMMIGELDHIYSRFYRDIREIIYHVVAKTNHYPELGPVRINGKLYYGSLPEWKRNR